MACFNMYGKKLESSALLLHAPMIYFCYTELTHFQGHGITTLDARIKMFYMPA